RELDLDRRADPDARRRARDSPGAPDAHRDRHGAGAARNRDRVVKGTLRWLVPLSAIPVLALLAYGFRLNPRDVPSPLVGRAAAPFTLETFDGAPLSLEGARGKVVVLNFWASWCHPACYEEAPVLERSWQAYRDRGL